MKSKNRVKTNGYWARMLSAILMAVAVPVAAECVHVGQVVSAQGTVEIQHLATAQWLTAELGDELCEGDTIRAGKFSRAEVALINESVLRLDQNTTMRLVDIAEKTEDKSLLALARGAFSSLSRKPRRITVSTPYVNGTIEGTEFLMSLAGDQAEIKVLEGTVVAQNDLGTERLGPGEGAVTSAGGAPSRYLLVRPRDAVHWALHYPPVVYLSPEGWAASGPEAPVRASVTAYLKGDLAGAFAALEQVPQATGDLRLLAYRASLLLAVGRIDEARADIDRMLQIEPGGGNANALAAIVAVAQGDNERALAAAELAAQQAPGTAAPWIARSYAKQATFDLDGALASAEQAVEVDAGNALAWARLAELQLAFGRLESAMAAAEKAAALAPELSRTQTVVGFAHLTRGETAAANAAFTAAIGMDQADPLPRLGLGLAIIRDGDLAKGRRELEVAASLDPNNALVRSYLGKAYFEEKRHELVEREYTTAMELDPKDPTPLFYRAIHRQTSNRPAEALADMQQAIALNDNRAVYRSRLLLDSDQAARSASQARIYADLGFEQLALVEGWKSVNTDPANHSAHRLLADSYAGQPRHEIARVSELLQSQLLQPLSMTPLAPQLAESNLFLIGAGGPSAMGLNEFNQVFNSDGLSLQTSALIGEHDTHGADAVVSGIEGNVSFSLGGFHYRTDGFRDNADQSDDIANAFVQAQLSATTSAQIEYRYRDNERGDLQQRFFTEDVFDTLRSTQERESIRLGLRHDFSPESTLLASFIHQDAKSEDVTGDFPVPGGFFAVKTPEDALTSELQHLYRGEGFKLRTGVGLVDLDSEENLSIAIPDLPPDVFSSETDMTHANGYGYADIDLLDDLVATLGLSYDSVDRDNEDDRDELNPKFGLTWTPIENTTVRAAVFKALKRTLVTDQTLEPTQVAGFNQFYDDINQTEFWRYGVGLDQKFSDVLFGGIELSMRDMKVPGVAVSDVGELLTTELDWQEYASRVYLFSVLNDRVSLRGEYIFERFERDDIGPEELDTHRFPLGIRYFDPSGLGGFVTATYLNQDGLFAPFLGIDPRSGKDQFWLLDAGVSYRLPNRYGFVSVGATNLTDEDFRFYEVDFNNATIQPTRSLIFRITLALP